LKFSREIERTARYDIAVVGGGVAGCAAALAAARCGAKTALIERDGVLGGTAGVGLVTPISSVNDRRGRPFGGILKEFCGEVVRLSEYCRPPDDKGPLSKTSVPHIAKYVLLKLLDDAGADIRFHTVFIDALTEKNMISGIVCHDKSGLILIKADQYIDASGDADLTVAAGEETVLGSEPGVYESLYQTGLDKVHESDSSYSVGEAVGLMQPCSVFFTMGGVDMSKAQFYNNKPLTYETFGLTRESYAELFYAGECGFEQDDSDRLPLPQGRVLVFNGSRGDHAVINMSRVVGIDGSNAEDISRGELLGQKQVLHLVDFLRRFVPGFENSYLIESSTSLGIRETRRLVGRSVLTGRQVIDGVSFPDTVAHGNYIIDIHDPTGKHKAIGGHIKGDYYEIPYGALLPKTLNNLLVCGRCISADHVAHSATRIQGSCMLTGQASGTAAAMAAKGGIAPAEVNVSALCERLIADGVNL